MTPSREPQHPPYQAASGAPVQNGSRRACVWYCSEHCKEAADETVLRCECQHPTFR
jgi:hypothetical protein